MVHVCWWTWYPSYGSALCWYVAVSTPLCVCSLNTQCSLHSVCFVYLLVFKRRSFPWTLRRKCIPVSLPVYSLQHQQFWLRSRHVSEWNSQWLWLLHLTDFSLLPLEAFSGQEPIQKILCRVSPERQVSNSGSLCFPHCSVRRFFPQFLSFGMCSCVCPRLRSWCWAGPFIISYHVLRLRS